MKAWVSERYGSPEMLELRDVAVPAPKDDEVLVKVCTVSINDWDVGILHGEPFVNRLLYGLRRPRVNILGSDVAGVIEAVGKNVRRFNPGDAVYGDLSERWGAFAEYVCAPEASLALKPAAMTFEEAAAIPQAAMLAVQGLRDTGRLASGQRLLINGAGGGVGTFGLQIAKTMGVEVTGVDAPEKLEPMRALGFDAVVDYTREDFVASGRQYDLILDVKTNRPPLQYLRALAPGGTYTTVGGSMTRLLQTLLLSPLAPAFGQKHLRIVALKPNKDLAYIEELYAAGSLKPIIDSVFSLRELPAALRRFEQGKHFGKIVIQVAAA